MHKLNGTTDYHSSPVHLSNSKILSNHQHSGTSYYNNSKPSQLIKTPTITQQKKNSQIAFKKTNHPSKENKFDRLPDI